MVNRKKLPIGIENFLEIRKDNFYYVDKTGLIEMLLNNWGKVNLPIEEDKFNKLHKDLSDYLKDKIPYIDENASLVKPEAPNGYKFETLVLDMIHMMDNCLSFEVEREKEFAPIKNRTGVDSLESARELMKLNEIALDKYRM